jgi:hypothetical protein
MCEIQSLDLDTLEEDAQELDDFDIQKFLAQAQVQEALQLAEQIEKEFETLPADKEAQSAKDKIRSLKKIALELVGEAQALVKNERSQLSCLAPQIQDTSIDFLPINLEYEQKIAPLQEALKKAKEALQQAEKAPKSAKARVESTSEKNKSTPGLSRKTKIAMGVVVTGLGIGLLALGTAALVTHANLPAALLCYAGALKLIAAGLALGFGLTVSGFAAMASNVGFFKAEAKDGHDVGATPRITPTLN